MTIKVFVSHDTADETLASALVDFLMAATNLEDSAIRCTSVPGHKLPVGAESATTLRDELGDSATVIGLLTRNSISSRWVLFELGATWGAKKNLKPLVSDDIDFKELPGPLSGHHAARLSSKSDLSQLIDEVALITGAQKRSGPKVDSAIDKLMAAHTEYVKSGSAKGKPKTIVTSTKELTISGIPFSELVTILRNEPITIPANIAGTPKDIKMSLFEVFVGNYQSLADGVQSNWEHNTAGGFLYVEVALRLLPYNLVKFEKLPATQAKWFRRLAVSDDGHKFMAQYKRATTTK